jgi:hypothetical protein
LYAPLKKTQTSTTVESVRTWGAAVLRPYTDGTPPPGRNRNGQLQRGSASLSFAAAYFMSGDPVRRVRKY